MVVNAGRPWVGLVGSLLQAEIQDAVGVVGAWPVGVWVRHALKGHSGWESGAAGAGPTCLCFQRIVDKDPVLVFEQRVV